MNVIRQNDCTCENTKVFFKKNKNLLKFYALGSALILSGFSFDSFAEKVKSIPVNDVRLLDSPFKRAQDADIEYILELDKDRLLAPYLIEAGLQPKAERYTNWENTGLDGHIGGHYLSALSIMYAATGNQECKEKLDYVISELKRCQDQSSDGYVSGVPGGKKIWQEIKEGNIRASAFGLNDRWVPLYNIHKIYAGLRDAYMFTGNEQAKEMLIKLTDWAIELTKDLSDAQMEDMLRSEHGGPNEVFADVYAITGDPKYLTLAERFSQKAIIEPLTRYEDKLTGMHANTQIPKVIGFKRVADLANIDSWNNGSVYFWENVTRKRSVAIGGNSVREHFHGVNDFRPMIESEEGPETCNSYNMLRLTKMFFESDCNERYADYYERTLYNHILSTINTERPGFVYFTPLRPGHYRVYSQPHTSFWCCVGSGLENHARYGEFIYAEGDESLYVNLYIPSTLEWKSKKVNMTMETSFPESEIVEFSVDPKKSTEFSLKLRYPSYVPQGEMKVWVNGEQQEIGKFPGTYVDVTRKWKKGDKVKVQLPMELRVEQMPDKSDYYALKKGPVVLAAKLSENDLDGLYADDSRGGHIARGKKYPLQEMPMFVCEKNEIINNLIPVENKPNAYLASNIIVPDQYKNVELVPFYTVHDARYSIYFGQESPEKYEEKMRIIAEQEAAKNELARLTLDIIYPGEQQPESDHFYKGEKTEAGTREARQWRKTNAWFGYQMRKNGGDPAFIRLTYHGADEKNDFKIIINGTPVHTVSAASLDNSHGYSTMDIEIPTTVLNKIKGDNFDLKFESVSGKTTTPLYEVRLMRN